MNKVYAIFSKENEYYQPDNNLIILYEDRPNIEQIRAILFNNRAISELKEDELIALVNLVQEKEVYVGTHDAYFRLEKIGIGQLLDLKEG